MAQEIHLGRKEIILVQHCRSCGCTVTVYEGYEFDAVKVGNLICLHCGRSLSGPLIGRRQK